MTASNADIGFNSTFGVEGNTAGTYVPIAEVTAITPPGFTREAIDVTHLKSPDGWAEHIAGIKRGGEATLTINYIPAASDAVLTAFEADSGKYEITFPNGIRLQFAGFFTGYSINELTVDGKMEATGTVQMSGKPTLAAAAGGSG
jgi:predicted secreted protein